MKERKKSWDEKCHIVRNSFLRIKKERHHVFARNFYNNLFFLNPDIKDYFKEVDMDHQSKALIDGLRFLTEYSVKDNANAHTQIARLSEVHSHKGLDVHPKLYYYWIEALIMTMKKEDPDWYDDMEYYWREVIFVPISFFISRFF